VKGKIVSVLILVIVLGLLSTSVVLAQPNPGINTKQNPVTPIITEALKKADVSDVQGSSRVINVTICDETLPSSWNLDIEALCSSITCRESDGETCQLWLRDCIRFADGRSVCTLVVVDGSCFLCNSYYEEGEQDFCFDCLSPYEPPPEPEPFFGGSDKGGGWINNRRPETLSGPGEKFVVQSLDGRDNWLVRYADWTGTVNIDWIPVGKEVWIRSCETGEWARFVPVRKMAEGRDEIFLRSKETDPGRSLFDLELLKGGLVPHCEECQQ